MAYERVNWENLPSTKTPVNATNMNKIENELSDLDSNKINLSYLTDYANGIARKIRVSDVDFNSLATYQSGLITILNATANAPVNKNTSHWYVLQIYSKEEKDYITQIATYFFDDIDSNIYIRKCKYGTWGAWRKILTSNNVISGQVTATTDNMGRILVPIPLGAIGANVISVNGDYFTFLRPLQSDKTNSLCYLKNTDNMQAIVNTSVTVVWSYIK